MLSELTIRNYALIESLHIELSTGFSIITGETGAGKSIIMGALGLLMGKRADLKAIKNPSQKCIIEGLFQIHSKNWKSWFERNDLDLDEQLIIRREIAPSGKSRSFINDTPVNLSLLQELGPLLIDVHSQHQNLLLNDADFQMDILDVLANHGGTLGKYKQVHQQYKSLVKELNLLVEEEKQAALDQDYHQFLFSELEEASLAPGEMETLEQERTAMEKSEEVQQAFSVSGELFESENGILDLIKKAEKLFDPIQDLHPSYNELAERVRSNSIELHDLARELSNYEGEMSFSPQRMQEINDRLNLIYTLLQKHRVNSIEELETIHFELSQKVNSTEDLKEKIDATNQKIEKHIQELNQLGKTLSDNRKAVVPQLQQSVEDLLHQMGMPEAQLNVQLQFNGKNAFSKLGMDEVEYLFTANKGMAFAPIQKIASGGEISRIMLSLKSILSNHKDLPTIVLDEIDTGISGDIAGKMGKIMKEMAEGHQLIAITHLPQVASTGDHHYKVFKDQSGDVAQSNIRKLSAEERVREVAQMLSGEEISDAAMKNAEILING